MKKISRFVQAALATTVLAGSAYAQTWPAKPIELFVGFPPGGGTDLSARTIAKSLEKHLGGSAKVVVVNKPGASGETALAYVLASKPDGYTLGTTNMPGFITVPIERADKSKYHFDDFSLLANLIWDPLTFATSADSKYKTLQDVIAEAKKNPGKVALGSTGVGTVAHITALQVNKMAGVELLHVPFSGAGPLKTAVIGNHVDIGGLNVGEFSALQGKIRVLAVARDTRSPLYPEGPTFKEAGGFNISAASERGIVAPKGLPADVRDKLEKALERVAKDPEFQNATLAQGNELLYLNGEQWRTHLAGEERRLKQLWTETPWAK